jgi:hypothetical protein
MIYHREVVASLSKLFVSSPFLCVIVTVYSGNLFFWLIWMVLEIAQLEFNCKVGCNNCLTFKKSNEVLVVGLLRRHIFSCHFFDIGVLIQIRSMQYS